MYPKVSMQNEFVDQFATLSHPSNCKKEDREKAYKFFSEMVFSCCITNLGKNSPLNQVHTSLHGLSVKHTQRDIEFIKDVIFKKRLSQYAKHDFFALFKSRVFRIENENKFNFESLSTLDMLYLFERRFGITNIGDQLSPSITESLSKSWTELSEAMSTIIGSLLVIDATLEHCRATQSNESFSLGVASHTLYALSVFIFFLRDTAREYDRIFMVSSTRLQREKVRNRSPFVLTRKNIALPPKPTST